MITFRNSFVFGTPNAKPLLGFPAGKVRLRLRANEFALARVRTVGEIREFRVKDAGDHWAPGPEVGSNHDA